MLQLLKILKILNSDANPSAIASAICLAMFIGFTPLLSPHNLLIILLVLILRVHLGTFILASLGFTLVGFAVQSSIEQFGLALLQNQTLEPFWTALYNTQFGRLSLFNYSTSLGGLAICLVSFVPMWLFTTYLVRQYRGHIMAWIQKNRLIQVLKGTTIIRLYNKSTGV